MRETPAPIISTLTLAAAIGALSATSPTQAAGDATAGRQVFARCAACHSTTPGENNVGPSLAGVFGRKSGSEPGYNYSPALKAASITWDEHTLDKFLANPAADVHGTKMFITVPAAADRQNVISYLETLK
ncbi:c-type cytochrome [Bradyrhizobium tropiciagri]|uniref:c-type cytochrome n=1 Tax=Bradyrhizobium tropiciagri TaxID=312253 RepID=UPI000A8C333B|nr:c-type cytochrome [Bradyrhizobium tropiciagri]